MRFLKVKNKMWLSFGCISIFAIIITLISVYNARRNTQNEKFVAAVKVSREDLSNSITLSAELRPFREVEIHSKVPGYVKSLPVDIGQQVKSGEVLAILDVPELKADFLKDQASYEQAKLDYQRIQAVIKKKPGLLAQAEVDKAKANYQISKAKLEHTKTLLDYSVITAPFDGVITKRFADEGTLIQAGLSSHTQSMPVVELAENKKLRIAFPVPESVVSEVKVNTPVLIDIQSTGEKIKSSISRIAEKVDTSTRTMATEIDLDNHNLHLVPGMYATVELSLDERKNVLSLPLQAIHLGEKPDVWRINEKNEIEEVPISLGIQTSDKAEILKGLQENDRIFMGNRSLINPGTKVKPKLVEVASIKEVQK